MLEPIKKLWRRGWRDHQERVLLGAFGVACVAALGACLAIGFSVGTFFGMMGALTVVAGVSLYPVMSRSLAETYADSRFRAEKQAAPYDRLQGPARNIKVMLNTQTMLSEKLYKYRENASLPPQALKGFEPYLRDAEEAARAVKSTDPETSIEQPTFALLRLRFDAAGMRSHETVAEIPLLQPGLLERQRREALEVEIDAMSHGVSRDVAVRSLRLKTPGGAP